MTEHIGKVLMCETVGAFEQKPLKSGMKQLSKEKILRYLKDLDEELRKKSVIGEVLLYGGAVMVLVFDARPATKDVDAVFMPVKTMLEAIKKVAEKNNLEEDWMNDGVKGFQSNVGEKQAFLNLSNLRLYVPTKEYLLAMKALASRVDAKDRADVEFLIKALGIKTAEEVFDSVEKYYPRKQIAPKTQFFIEEVIENVNGERDSC